jgi:hypothetical protein
MSLCGIPVEITCDYYGDKEDTVMFNVILEGKRNGKFCAVCGHGMTLLDAIKNFDYEFITKPYFQISKYNSMVKDCIKEENI